MVTDKPLGFLYFATKSLGPPPPSSSSSGAPLFLCSLLCRRLSALPIAALTPPRRHLLLGQTPRVTWTPAAASAHPCWPFPMRATPTRMPPGRGTNRAPRPVLYSSALELLQLMTIQFCASFLPPNAPSPEHHRRPFLHSGDLPVHRGQLTRTLPAPLQPPRELPLTPLTLPGHSSRPDPHRNHLAAVHSLRRSFGLPQEPHLRSSLPLPKTSRRCTLSSWCSLAAPSPLPTPPLAGTWPAMSLPLLPHEPSAEIFSPPHPAPSRF
jgi:hypothetical protein